MLVPLLALAGLSACSDSDGSSKTPRPSSGPTGTASASTSATPASWKTVAMPGAALPSHPTVSVADSVPVSGSLPGLLVGSVTKPGGAGRATTWLPSASGLGKATPLHVAGADSSADATATDGTTTVVAGSSWTKGTTTQFVQSSTDRKTWHDVALPKEVTDRGIDLGGLAVLSGKVLALGIDEDHRPVVVDTAAGTVADLPTADAGELSGFSDVAVQGRTVVALASGEAKSGTPTVVGYRSTDAGRSWKQVAAPRGQQVTVFGIVSVPYGFVATGWHQAGGDDVAGAWFSTDGARWKQETLPALRDHDPGWNTYLTDPTTSGGVVYAAATDSERLWNQVLQRSANGTWSVLGEAPSWVTPGPDASVVADETGVTVVRTWNGGVQTGWLSRSGSWSTTGHTSLDAAPVSWWDSVDLLGGTPVLVGGHTDVRLGSGTSWTRLTKLARFSVAGDRLSKSRWVPKAAADLTGVSAGTSTRGTSVVIGERVDPTDRTNASDLIGWVRPKGGAWRTVTGLAGPRTEFLNDLTLVGSTWVAVGDDRASFTGSDHSYGAVWVSRDGEHWQRGSGPFDVDPKLDSTLSGSCRLPDGNLLAVGDVESAATGTAPIAFARTRTGWTRHAFKGLGPEVRSLDSCAAAGKVTLIQGTEGAHVRMWSTSDGVHLTRVSVGADDDVIGTVVSIPGGFAAPGGRYQGATAQPVVWLSRDGRAWHPVDVPTDHPASADTVLPWGDRLLVALTGSDGGPSVSVLDNPAQLLGG